MNVGGFMGEQVAVRPWETSDILQIAVENDTIVLRKAFRHKTFEERVAEYGGEISICDFDWGEPLGRELL